jgi:ABC transport system ATP-binding/permease protein
LPESRLTPVSETSTPKKPAPVNPPKAAPDQKRKRSYKEQQELNRLPAEIESLEQRKSSLEHTLSKPDFYQSPPEEIHRATEELGDIILRLEAAYERWDQLEAAR